MSNMYRSYTLSCCCIFDNICTVRERYDVTMSGVVIQGLCLANVK